MMLEAMRRWRNMTEKNWIEPQVVEVYGPAIHEAYEARRDDAVERLVSEAVTLSASNINRRLIDTMLKATGIAEMIDAGPHQR